MLTQKAHQTAYLGFVEISGSTTAPMELTHVTALKERRTVTDLFPEHIQIFFGFMLLAGDQFIAAAEVESL